MRWSLLGGENFDLDFMSATRNDTFCMELKKTTPEVKVHFT